MMNSNRAIAKSSLTAETPSAQRQRREEKNSALSLRPLRLCGEFASISRALLFHHYPYIESIIPPGIAGQDTLSLFTHLQAAIIP